MGSFYRSQADSTPRATQGSVIKVQKEPVELETGKIVEDKEEVPIKNILDEMTLMFTNGEIGSQSEESTAGGIGEGFGKNMNQLNDIMKMAKDLISKIQKGNKDENSASEKNMIESTSSLVSITKNIPQFTYDQAIDSKILVNISSYLENNVQDNGDPFGIFLLDTSELFKDLDSYLNKEFSSSEKIEILRNLNIHNFFDDVSNMINNYQSSLAPTLNSISSSLSTSINDFISQAENTNKMIDESLKKQESIQNYNKELRNQREAYKKHMIEEELGKLTSNPTEEKIIYANEYDKHLDILRNSRL